MIFQASFWWFFFFDFYGGSGVLVGGKVSMAEMGEIRAYRGTPYDSQKNIK